MANLVRRFIDRLLSKQVVSDKKSYDMVADYLRYGNPCESTSYSYRVNDITAIAYYNNVAPISIGIDLISEEFEVIEPFVFDQENQEYDDSDETQALLSLLKMPNADTTMGEFMGNIARFFQITANAYVIATGKDIDKPPMELFTVPSQNVAVYGGTDDPFADYYIVNSARGSYRFNRAESDNIRYVNNQINAELLHIKSFNTDSGQSNLTGRSKLNSIYLEIEQYYYSGKHNLSTLKNGVTSSGALISEEPLTDDQREKIRQEILSKKQGADNAGSLFIFDRGKFDFKEMSKSLKDMDFRNLKLDVSLDVYNRLKIPLPLVSTKNQKYDNMFQAKLSLYDNAVLPLTKKIYEELSLFLLPRFDLDTNQYKITYNPHTIPIMQEREINKAFEISKMGILTINEMRALFGYDGVDGGDVIYQPFNLVPIGSSDDADSKSKRLKNFRTIMGKYNYDDKEINNLAIDYFGEEK